MGRGGRRGVLSPASPVVEGCAPFVYLDTSRRTSIQCIVQLTSKLVRGVPNGRLTRPHESPTRPGLNIRDLIIIRHGSEGYWDR